MGNLLQQVRKLLSDEPMEGTVFQTCGRSGMIRIWKDDTVINGGDTAQSARFYLMRKVIESEPVVPDSVKENLVWMPSARREELLETWWQRRQEKLTYCEKRITATMKDIKKYLGDDF